MVESYDMMVSHYQFLLRCTPCDATNGAPFQRLVEHQLHLLSSVKVQRGEDCFSNIIHYGTLRNKHDLFVVSSTGVVDCSDYKIPETTPRELFRHETPLTRLDEAITQFGESIASANSHLNTALALCEAVHSIINYTKGATSVTTTAAECFAARAGVCQDLSHLLIALCRQRGIYARYVVGYIAGEGESHAWCEIWSDGCWYGVDPTHNRIIEEGYIKVSHGRDAADCSIIRGLRRGVANHTTTIRVIVEEER